MRGEKREISKVFAMEIEEEEVRERKNFDLGQKGGPNPYNNAEKKSKGRNLDTWRNLVMPDNPLRRI